MSPEIHTKFSGEKGAAEAGEGMGLADAGIGEGVAVVGVEEGEAVLDSVLLLLLEGYTGQVHLAYAAAATSTGGLLKASDEQFCPWAIFRR